MNPNYCKKCGKEIPENQKKCDYCRKSSNEVLKKVSTVVVTGFAGLVGVIITKGKK